MIFHKNVEKIYKGYFFGRSDDNGMLKHFSHKDFEGLNARPYEFNSSKGHKLKGYFYSYEGYNPERLIIWEHGIGSFHRSYMKEIEILCSNGFCVFAYDHTGCMESGGEGQNGLCQSLCDLNDCINSLKADKGISPESISVVGHSWGGYSTLNIVAFHPQITHIVAFAGFVSVDLIQRQQLKGMQKLYRKDLYRLEKKTNPEFVDCNAVNAIKNSSVKAMIIHSDDDPVVDFDTHFGTLQRELGDRKNTVFLRQSGKWHNPSYTAEAATYLSRLFVDMKDKNLTTFEEKEAFKASYDWEKITEQDSALWNKIIEFLNS